MTVVQDQRPSGGCEKCGGTVRTHKEDFGWMCTKCVKASGRVPCRWKGPKATVPYQVLPMIEDYQRRFGLSFDTAVSQILSAGLEAMQHDESLYIDPAERYAAAVDYWTAQ